MIGDVDGTTFNSGLCSPLVAGFKVGETYTYSPSGQQVQRFNGRVWENDNLYTDQKLLASYYGNKTNYGDQQYYEMSDWVGTTTAQITADGNPANLEEYLNLPYGDGVSEVGSSPDTTGLHLTGKEYDLESRNSFFEARYYQSNAGRFLSPDFNKSGDDPEPVPYADLEGPQSLNLYSYVGNNPLSRRDADGHSYVVYDGSSNTLTLYSGTGSVLGVYPANNNVDSRASLGKLPDGTYPVIDQTSPHMHGDDVDPSDSNPQDSEDGEFGPGGIFRVQFFKGPDGKIHRGVGVHAGRRNKPDKRGRTGPAHATQGCIRTCDAAIQKITSTAKTDPLTSLEVTFNRPADNSSVTTSQGAATPCGGSTGTPCPK